MASDNQAQIPQAQLSYQTSRWGGVEGCHHFNFKIGDHTAQITVDSSGIEIFAPIFLSLDDVCSNYLRLKFVDSIKEVREVKLS